MLTVRNVTANDFDAVVRLLPRLADPSFCPPYYQTQELVDGTSRMLRGALERASADELFLVADDDGVVAGFIWANEKPDYFTQEIAGYIEEIAVTRDGAGIGTMLMDAAERWSVARGHRYIGLSVRPGNARAKALYDRRAYGIDVEHRVKLHTQPI